MCALILGGGVFGEMRGKMGSLVFARNRAGAYVRNFVKPVDPATIAQLAARNNFASASNIYHSLTDLVKSEWENFATETFNPKTGVRGVSSGFNAFVSLANTVKNSKPMTSTVWNGVAPLVGTNIPLAILGVPPTFGLETNFRTNTGGSIPFGFKNVNTFTKTLVSLTTTFSGNIEFSIDGSIGTSGTVGASTDAKNNLFGFKVFMSNPIAQPHMFVQNPYLIDLGTILPMAFTAPISELTTLDIDFTSTLINGNYKTLPITNQYVQITVFQVSKYGMLSRLGSSKVKVLGGA